MSADVTESMLKEAHIVDALDSNARGSLTAIGTSCEKSWENTEGLICFGMGEVLRSGLGDTVRWERLCGRS